jgi:RHS repeat-associated protein
VHGDEATYYIGPVEIETNQGDVTETHSIYSLGGGVNAVRVVASPGDDGEVTFTFGDHLGSSSTVWQTGELGDTDPGVRSYQRYYPYGEPRDDYSPALPTDHTFTGQISDGLLDDGGTGLMYYGARYYDPQVGRFAAADTIVPNPGNPQDLNRYSYVGNNPVNGIDPSGHGPCYDEEGNPINCTDGTCTHSGGPPDSISMMTGTFDDSGCAYDEAGLGSALAGFVNWIGDGLSWLGREGWELLKEGARRLKEGGEYFVATTTRRFSNPTQSLFDLVTLTAFVEDLGGLYGTVIAGGDVDQTNCPAYATCIQRMHLPVLSAGSTAQAVGGTVLSEGRLTPRLGAHEGTHVRDMHELGFVPFAVWYVVESIGGKDQNYFEQRARSAEERALQADYGEDYDFDERDLEGFYPPSVLPHWLTPWNFRE